MWLVIETEVGQALAQLGGLAAANRELQLTGVVKGLAQDAGLHVFHHAHDAVHHGIGEIVGDDLFHLARFLFGMGKGKGGGLTVGHNEATCAEIDATIIAHHDDEDVGQLGGIDLPEDGFSCGGGWLAIVVGTEILAFCSQHIGIAHMTGVVEPLSVTGKKVLHLVVCLDMMGPGKELRAFLGVVALAHAADSGVGVVSHFD